MSNNNKEFFLKKVVFSGNEKLLLAVEKEYGDLVSVSNNWEQHHQLKKLFYSLDNPIEKRNTVMIMLHDLDHPFFPSKQYDERYEDPTDIRIRKRRFRMVDIHSFILQRRKHSSGSQRLYPSGKKAWLRMAVPRPGRG